MAWTEQCKIAFKVSADGRVLTGESVSEVLKDLSAQSEIPASTLEKWYYDKSYSENGVTPKDTRQGKGGTESENWPLCSRCGRKHVEKGYKDGKPHKSGLCWSCRRKQSKEQESEKEEQKFMATPVNPEAEACWREIAEKLSELTASINIIGKVGEDVLMMVLDTQFTLNAKISELVNLSIYESESG